MKRIELIGAAGVGKSSLLQFLIKIRKTKNLWHTSQEARSEILKSPHIYNKAHFGYLNKIGLSLPVIKNTIKNEIFKDEYKNALWSYNNEWKDFIHTCINKKIFSAYDSVRILYRYQWLLMKLEEAALFKKYQSEKYVILDESVCQKLWPIIILLDRSKLGEISEELFYKVPLPHGMIHIDADRDLIYQRLSKRESLKDEWILGYRGYDERALYQVIEDSLTVIRTGVKSLRKRGVDILDISASENIDDKVRKVNHFLNDLTKRN